ncbi:MAG: catalase [Nitrospirales bacterium]
MHYALFAAMIMALVACDTVPTHPNDEIHKAHSNIIANQKKQNSYPKLDSNPPYFNEKENPNEKILAYKIADEAMYTVNRNYDQENKKASRDAHPKENGCVNAEFHVKGKLPDKLAKGVFAPGQAYEALIRFSNSSENPKGNDHDPDARGMAIKLTNKHEKKNKKGEGEFRTMNQDFVMINHPVFILDDPSDYLSLVQAQNSTSTLGKLFKIPFALGFRGIWNAYHTIFQDQVLNPLQTQYYSMVPYRLGNKEDQDRRAIKFSVRPFSNPSNHQDFPEKGQSCIKVESDKPKQNAKNYLRTALFKTLETGGACMEFLIQLAPEGMSVENSQVEWDSPFTPVALIKIPQITSDEVDSTGKKKIHRSCEDESFDPWHAWDEHRPLGVVNRLRKVIYPIVSDYRECLNYPSRDKCQVKAKVK